ncbi:MAG: M28 family peptidase [Ekhidna sp.]|uniref:M28 family metallopeptidase n=1 Tax=Ekhidna sp. TaxID=2608089 RepID=UPI0032EFF08C
MKLSYILLILIVPIFNIHGQQDSLIREQQQMIGELSGKYEWNGKSLNARSSSEERNLARDYLKDKIRSLGLEPKEHTYLMPNLNPLIDLLFAPFKGANVYTILEATEKIDEYIVLGAHFDTEVGCPGAIDNGTGVTLIFSVVKKLQSLDYRSKNIILIFFDQEEEELVGSQAFARHLKKEGLKIHSVHTVDTIGWDADGDGTVELELPSAELEMVYTQVSQRIGQTFHLTRVNSTDHHSFRKLGYPAIGLTDEYVNGDYAPYKDTPQDIYETVNFEFLAKSTVFVYEVIKEIINQ